MGAINKSNHPPHHCLLNRLFRRRSKKTSKLRVTDFCVRNSPVTGEFPAQMASNAKNVSIWWRHNDQQFQQSSPPPTRFMWSIWSEHTIDICFLLTCVSQNVTNLVSWFVVQIGHFPRHSNYIILSEMNFPQYRSFVNEIHRLYSERENNMPPQSHWEVARIRWMPPLAVESTTWGGGGGGGKLIWDFVNDDLVFVSVILGV